MVFHISMPRLLIYSGHYFIYKNLYISIMKIEIIKGVAGMPVGTTKTVDDAIGKDLVNNGWAKDSDGKYKAKSEQTDDISVFLNNAGLIGEDALKEVQGKGNKEADKRKTK